jgi:hypothetical protein
MPVPLPPYLTALSELTAQLDQDPTLATLRTQIEGVRASLATAPDPPAPQQPQANAPAPPAPETNLQIKTRLLAAVAKLVGQAPPATDWRQCPTPGCNARRWP